MKLQSSTISLWFNWQLLWGESDNGKKSWSETELRSFFISIKIFRKWWQTGGSIILITHTVPKLILGNKSQSLISYYQELNSRERPILEPQTSKNPNLRNTILYQNAMPWMQCWQINLKRKMLWLQYVERKSRTRNLMAHSQDSFNKENHRPEEPCSDIPMYVFHVLQWVKQHLRWVHNATA